MSDYDIVIAGGGMIGSSLALELAPLGLRVAVVEAIAREEQLQPSFDERSTALSRSTQRMFEAMNLWEDVVAASTPIREIHVSDKGRFGFSHIDAKEQKVEALGYVVINRVLGAVLQTCLDEADNIDVFCPARIESISLSASAASATLVEENNQQTLDCRLLVASDGANSAVREMMGISTQRYDYGQCAVIGNLQPEMKLRNRAYERFTSEGPLAILPIANERAAFIWTVASRDAERVMALDDAMFLAEMQTQFGYRLGEFTRVGERGCYPLLLSKAVRLVANRSVLVGNSAHGLHPVSAQGFNLGMRDVAALCDCIADAQQLGTDLGGVAVLDRYAEWRRSDQKKVTRFTDGLVRLFGSSQSGLRLLRDMGMIGFDLIPGVRSMFAKHTMGLAGNLPRLSRGVSLR